MDWKTEDVDYSGNMDEEETRKIEDTVVTLEKV